MRESHTSESALRAAAQEVLEADGAAESGDPFADRRWDYAMNALKAALDGAPWEPSEELVERTARAMWQFDVDHGQYTSPEPPSPPEPDDYEWRQARAALKAAMGIESGSAG